MSPAPTPLSTSRYGSCASQCGAAALRRGALRLRRRTWVLMALTVSGIRSGHDIVPPWDGRDTSDAGEAGIPCGIGPTRQ
ncbi:hypothetical protein GCM10022254_47950 [Actinomadura meridiana]|uniref:Uncharacterized protein n=1 Tax=Actinomadura meridiana TaxID=559626 RepID=A0ABP8CBC5_9ACTN